MTDEELDSFEDACKAALDGMYGFSSKQYLELIAMIRQARRERDWLAGKLADHCSEQDSSVYSAASEYCTMCKSRCIFPYTECSDINRKLWLDAAKEATCPKN